ncbi:hypothetical protein [Chlorobium sp. N1]|uniref:hypothetical protein n=1 Tax=Chlorobium sp. N1 TaxID=2491138 RepID=UPI00103C126E|nr:hypothetical protein [Chlorobium sp. N1]TCD47033.1 hypothetical protein E0L29_10400 [Chlorobium sp. N1]
MDIFLQLWGGGWYLFNKILFSLSETEHEIKNNQLTLLAWLAYLIGVPAWVFLLIAKNDWIAASIEASGIPAMLLGLYKAYSTPKAPPSLEQGVKYLTYLAVLFGCLISIREYGGIVSASQCLEIGVTIGFLMGSYLMTQHDRKGYLFFMLMNTSMASLMYLQGKNILLIQQLLSLLFVGYGYRQASRNRQPRQRLQTQ